MYLKEEIILVSSPLMYMRYTFATDNVTVFLYSYSTKTDLTQMDRVYTLAASLFNNQYSVDQDRSAVYFAPVAIGNYVRVVYYSEGAISPFYASSNLNQFITQVLEWTANRISEGIYLYWENCDPATQKRIQQGSFVYNNQFYVYNGGTFDIRVQSPPTSKGKIKAYYLFINQEIVSSYIDNQTQILSKLGIISSSISHETVDSAKTDVLARYTSMYASAPLQVALIYIQLLDNYSYDMWIEYPPSTRTL